MKKARGADGTRTRDPRILGLLGSRLTNVTKVDPPGFLVPSSLLWGFLIRVYTKADF